MTQSRKKSRVTSSNSFTATPARNNSTDTSPLTDRAIRYQKRGACEQQKKQNYRTTTAAALYSSRTTTSTTIPDPSFLSQREGGQPCPFSAGRPTAASSFLALNHYSLFRKHVWFKSFVCFAAVMTFVWWVNAGGPDSYEPVTNASKGIWSNWLHEAADMEEYEALSG